MNPWKAFDRLTKTGGSLYIGTVSAVNSSFGDQRCTVTLLPGGGSLEVTGTGRTLAIGQKWLIQDRAIIDDAPTGTPTYVDI